MNKHPDGRRWRKRNDENGYVCAREHHWVSVRAVHVKVHKFEGEWHFYCLIFLSFNISEALRVYMNSEPMMHTIIDPLHSGLAACISYDIHMLEETESKTESCRYYDVFIICWLFYDLYQLVFAFLSAVSLRWHMNLIIVRHSRYST